MPKHPLPAFVTHKRLYALGACESGRDYAERSWRHEIPLTLATLRRLAAVSVDFIDWAVYMLSAETKLSPAEIEVYVDRCRGAADRESRLVAELRAALDPEASHRFERELGRLRQHLYASELLAWVVATFDIPEGDG